MTMFSRPGAARSGTFHACLRRGWLLLPCLLLAFSAQAQQAQQVEETPPGADVASIHGWLLAHNPELRAQQAEVEAAQARVDSAGSLPNPTAALSVQGLGTGSDNVTSYQLRQQFPLWGKRGLARAIAAQMARAQAANRSATALQLLAQAEAEYVRYWHAAQALLLVDARIALLDRIEEISGVRYALGMVPQQDAIRAQVAISAERDRRIRLEQTGEEAGMLLNLALGRPPDAALRAPESVPRLAVASATLGDALRRLDQDRHPALRAAEAQLAAAQDTLRLRQRERWPDITVGIGALRRGSRSEGYELMLEVELPLQRRAIAARERAALHTQDAQQARVEAQQTALAGQLGVAWSQWRSAQRQRTLLETTRVPQAEANFNSALASYQVGEVDFNALLDALTQWQDARLSRLDAERDQLLAAAAVRALEGETP